MSIEEKTQFTLEVEPAVVLRLARDVASHLLALRLAHRKRAIARLPLKRLARAVLCLRPQRGRSVQLLDPVGKGDRTGLASKKMDMVLNTSHDNGWTIEPRRDLGQITVHSFTSLLVTEQRATPFGGEDNVDENVRERLRHRGTAGMPGTRNPFRVLILGELLPRVAASRQPWAMLRNTFGVRIHRRGA